jgi:hypothetical protein
MGTFPWGKSGPGVKLISHLNLQPRSRIVELYLHSPHVFMAWQSIKHRDNFNFYLAMTQQNAVGRIIGLQWIVNWEGHGRKWPRPILGIIPAFAWKGWRKWLETSVRIFGVTAEIRTWRLPRTSQDRLPPEPNWSLRRVKTDLEVKKYKLLSLRGCLLIQKIDLCCQIPSTREQIMGWSKEEWRFGFL